MRTAPLVAGLVAALVALSGCAESPAPVETATPPAFPRIAGTVAWSQRSASGDWHVRVEVPDGATAYARARRLLTAHGYRLTNDEPAADGGAGQACTTALCVSFSATTRSGAGASVEYEVFHSTGMTG
jgi:hypothetical protein